MNWRFDTGLGDNVHFSRTFTLINFFEHENLNNAISSSYLYEQNIFELSLSYYLPVFVFSMIFWVLFLVFHPLRHQGVANSELLTFVTLFSVGGEGRGGEHQATNIFV